MPILRVMKQNRTRRRESPRDRRCRRLTGAPIVFASALLALIAAAPVAAYGPAVVNPPPETDDVRRAHLDDALAPVSDLDAFRPTVATAYASGRDVLVTTERNAEYAYFVVVPELDGEFPLSSAGTYILRRRRADGAIDQLKIFLRSDPGFFVRSGPSAPATGGSGRAVARPNGRR